MDRASTSKEVRNGSEEAKKCKMGNCSERDFLQNGTSIEFGTRKKQSTTPSACGGHSSCDVTAGDKMHGPQKKIHRDL